MTLSLDFSSKWNDARQIGARSIIAEIIRRDRYSDISYYEGKDKDFKSIYVEIWGVVCVPVVAPDKTWRFDAKNDIAFYGQPEGVVGRGRVLFPWDGRVLVCGSLSKVTGHINNINRWIGVRNEIMQGKLW